MSNERGSPEYDPEGVPLPPVYAGSTQADDLSAPL